MTTKFDLNTLPVPESVRREARRMANNLLMSEGELTDLLNPLQHHHTGKGAKRAAQLRKEYASFTEQTVNQVMSSTSLPAGAPREEMSRDLQQRAEAVNDAFRNLACHAVAELTEPTPMPPDPTQAPHNVRVHQYGPAPASDISRGVVDRLTSRSGHFWNSVQRRVARNNWDTYAADDDWDDYDEDDQCCDSQHCCDDEYPPYHR